MQPEHGTPQTTSAIKEVKKVDILTVSAVLVLLAVAMCPVEATHPHKMLHVCLFEFGQAPPMPQPYWRGLLL